MTQIVDLQRADALRTWLLDAAVAFGQTLQADAQTGDVPEAIDIARIDARAVLEERRRALDPVPYDGEDYFHQHVSQALGKADALVNPDHPRAGMPDRTGPLRPVLEQLLRDWEPPQGAATLYLLLDLAQQHRLEMALETLNLMLARGALTTVPAAWRKALGRKTVALGYTFAPLLVARNLLNEMPERTEYWTPECSVMTAAGLVQAEPDKWYPHLARFQPELETLQFGTRRSALRQVISGAGFRNLLIGSSAILPYAFRPDGTPLFKGGPEHLPTLNLLFQSDATPIKTSVSFETLHFQNRDVKLELPEIANQPEVREAYRAAMGPDWDPERTLESCSYSFMYLTNTKEDLSSDAGLRSFDRATAGSAAELSVLRAPEAVDHDSDDDMGSAWDAMDELQDLMRADDLLDAALGGT